MKIALIGTGKMGSAVKRKAEASGDTIVSLSDINDPLTLEKLSQAEVVIDFSSPDAVMHHIEMASAAQIPIVIGTTGWNEKIPEAQALIEKKGKAALFSPNFSIGVALFKELLSHAKELFSPFSDFEMAGVEVHHSAKKDAPSGTAKAIMALFDGKLPMSSVRVGTICGTHTLLIDSPFETITLSHEAKNRDGFAEGAHLAAKWLINKRGWYGFDFVIRSLYSSRHSL